MIVLLVGIEVRIAAQFIGVPDVQERAGDGIAVRVAHLAFHDQDLAARRILVQPRLSLGQRRARDVERPLDRARRARGPVGGLVGLFLADVDQAVEPQARGDQANLAAGAQAGKPIHAGPELVGLDVEVVDRAEQVRHDALRDLPDPFVARVYLGTVDQVQ